MILVVDGIPCSGKSTLVEVVRRFLAENVGEDHVVVLDDPQDGRGCREGDTLADYRYEKSILDKLLENEQRAVRWSRRGRQVVVNRSLLYGYRVFKEKWQKVANISAAEKHRDELRFGSSPISCGTQDYIRLWVEAETHVCLQRILERMIKPGDERVTTTYLMKLERVVTCLKEVEAKKSVTVEGTYKINLPVTATVEICQTFEREHQSLLKNLGPPRLWRLIQKIFVEN